MGLLQMSGVRKSFPGVLALDKISFEVSSGEIRALMGENGAGKSTLIKVLTGVHPLDAGSITLEGNVIAPDSPVHAQSLGISTVYQEVNLVPNLTVSENICLGSGSSLVSWRAMGLRSQEALERMGLRIDPRRLLGELSTAEQQLVAVARALDRSAKVLVLDEPTSSLDRDEVARLFDLMQSLKSTGMAIVFVTHFIDQVYAVADSVTVLRNGAKVGDWNVSELSRKQLVAHMLGRELEEVPHVERQEEEAARPYLRVEGIGRQGTLEPVSFEVGVGETVGLSGLLGSGRTETMKLLFGALGSDSGSLVVGGARVRPCSPVDMVRRGFGFCPEDRKAEGICPGLSVAENMLLVVQSRRGWLRPLSRKSGTEIVNEHLERLQIKARGASTQIETLSGGNQQKVLLSRWLASDPKLLLLDEPTRGIDIGSKFEIRRQIVELAKRGMSFLFSSAELEETVNTCDRVIVLRDRKMVGELRGDEVTEQNVMSKIAEGGL